MHALVAYYGTLMLATSVNVSIAWRRGRLHSFITHVPGFDPQLLRFFPPH